MFESHPVPPLQRGAVLFFKASLPDGVCAHQGVLAQYRESLGAADPRKAVQKPALLVELREVAWVELSKIPGQGAEGCSAGVDATT